MGFFRRKNNFYIAPLIFIIYPPYFNHDESIAAVKIVLGTVVLKIWGPKTKIIVFPIRPHVFIREFQKLKWCFMVMGA